MPEWIESLISGDPKSLQRRVEETLSERNMGYVAQEVSWALQREQAIDAEWLIQKWQPIAEKLFGQMLEKWKGIP